MIKSAVNLYVKNEISNMNNVFKNINLILKKIIFEFVSFFPLLKKLIKKIRRKFVKNQLMQIEKVLEQIKEKNILFNKKEIIIISKSIQKFYENYS